MWGNEGHGTIRFRGICNSISSTVPIAEGWHGFTIGIEGAEPLITSITRTNTDAVVAFTTIPQVQYKVLATTNLAASSWSVIASTIVATGGVVTNTDVGGASHPSRFYKAGAHD